jgi:predicted RNA polymerase sigma factor
VSDRVEEIYRSESRRVLATLIRLLGDFDVAEEAMHDAFAAAVEQWARDGVPANPRAWLVSAGRFTAIDAMRRRARFDASAGELAARIEAAAQDATAAAGEEVEDDRLRLIFTCCHPALPIDAQVALTLREVCGLPTETIAHVSGPGADRRAADRPCEGKNPRRAHPVSGALAARPAWPARCRAPRDLSRLQRGVLRFVG